MAKRAGLRRLENLLHQEHNAQNTGHSGDRGEGAPARTNLRTRWLVRPSSSPVTTPMQLGAMIQRCRLFISNDTGTPCT